MSNKTNVGLTHLTQRVEEALEHINDILWLGQNSPLAQPYFIHEYLLRHTNPAPENRGQVLRTLFDESKEEIKLEDEDFWHVIHVYYTKEVQDSIRNTYNKLKNEIYISHSTFKRKKPGALKLLGEILLKKIKPAWRLENPKPPKYLIGRDVILERCKHALTSRQTIGLSGSSGMGKTALGRQLVTGHPFFWFTLRIGLNDHIFTIFFELAIFLKQQLPQGSVLFNELSVTKETSESKVDKFDYNKILGYLRYDIQNLDKMTIFCFDEMDWPVIESTTHDVVFNFLSKDFIAFNLPTIFMAQEVPFQTDLALDLEGITLEDMVKFLDYYELTGLDYEKLYKLTQGNPLWLELFVALQKRTKKKDILQEWLAQPQIAFLLNQLFQRLTRSELTLIYDLAVFEYPAPPDAWLKQGRDKFEQLDKTITSLVTRHLVEQDDTGGISLTASLRQLIIQELSLEARLIYHDKAATIWGERGQYTEMLYHATKGRYLLNESLWLWHQHQQLELEQGHGAKALRILEQLEDKDLTYETRAILNTIMAELYNLLGQYDKVKLIPIAPLRHHLYLRYHVERIKADVYTLQGNYRLGREEYQTTLRTQEKLIKDKVVVFGRLRLILQKEGDLARARHYIEQAHYEVQKMYGSFYMRSNKHHEAQHHFSQALYLAEELHDQEEIATSHERLALNLTDLNRFEDAEIHFQKALKIYERIGRKTYLAGFQSNLAYFYNRYKDWEKSLFHATAALQLYQVLDEKAGEISAIQNMAEAHFHLGNLVQAEQYAQLVYQAEDSELMADCMWLLGEIALQRGQLKKSAAWLQQAFQIGLDNEYKLIQGYAQRGLTKVYLAQKQFTQAKEAWLKALELLQDTPTEVEELKLLLPQFPPSETQTLAQLLP